MATHRPPLLALIAAALALTAAGCGHSAPPTPGGSPAGAASGELAYAACMRSHGIADFPDPRNGGYQVNGTPSSTIVNGVTIHESSAQFGTADQACQRFQGPASPAGPPNPQLKRAALVWAECMRSHGIANFPDPRVTSHSIAVRIGPGMDPKSPLFLAARRACRPLMPLPGRSKGGRG